MSPSVRPLAVAVLTAADLPGENNCAPVVKDDPILADGLVDLAHREAARGERREVDVGAGCRDVMEAVLAR